ncbi:MAG: tetratricopeptide repeat protein [Myxococcota bacterium]
MYSVGLFYYMTKKPTEALSYFRQSEERIAALGSHPVVKELYYYKGLAHVEAGETEEAKRTFGAGLRYMQEGKDWRKMCAALDHLATIEQKAGNVDVARKLLTDAVQFAQQGDLREERKELRKKLDALT